MEDIILTGISKAYGEKKVITDFSHTFPKGEITCIKGPSGCGKTTLLRIISGLEPADGGTIENKPDKVAFLFQEDRLCDEFNAVSNIRLVTGVKMSREKIKSHLRELGLGDNLVGAVGKFSGGMKRRVAIARTVCYGAELVIMDEPFKGLDAKLRDDVIGYVKKYTDGKTVICVTHDDYEAEAMGGILFDMSR